MLTEAQKKLLHVGKNKKFNSVFKKLCTNANLTFEDKSYILSTAILFLKHFQKDNRHTTYADLAYFIILKYSLTYKDFYPLYDFSLNFGFYPISNSLIKENLIEIDNIQNAISNSNIIKFKNKNNYIETLEQNLKSNSFLNDSVNEKGYLAPTSFGKSSLILDYIEIEKSNEKIVIIVPTKSLLIQTYQMIKESKIKRKIIIHEEMYNDEKNFIAIFTQERALRLLRNKQIHYDILIIDEAHNLLKNDNRSILLSRLISKNKNRNPNCKIIYLSPLINNINNLKIEDSQNLSSHIIHFNIKEPEIFEFTFNNKKRLYNRFTNLNYDKKDTSKNILDYIVSNSNHKNFIYNYRPIKIEETARRISSKLKDIENSKNINSVIRILEKEVHPNFYAIDYVKKGLIYLHGNIPEIIKEYLEHKYRTLKEFKFIVANSVILEGINMPIDSLFILNTYNLHGKELINLIGRVNRLNEVFTQKESNLEKLLPHVHFVNNKEYNGEKSDMSNKIQILRSRIFEDKIDNPTLDSFDINDLKGKEEDLKNKKIKIEKIIENENFITKTHTNQIDSLKQYLIESNISDIYINIDKAANEIQQTLNRIEKDEDWNNNSVLDKINLLFLTSIENINDFEIKRLNSIEARNYYQNYILVSQKKSLTENVEDLVSYFNSRIASNTALFYIGSAYGEIAKETNSYNKSKKPNKVYIDLSDNKSKTELVNLAIVKLKMEDNFISFKLNKFIVMLMDFKLISTNEYNKYIYGTTDEKRIALTKYGMSINLITRIIKDSQLENIYFDEYNNLKGNDKFKHFLTTIDDFYRFEINRHLN
jgi:superfamily II DNA or RNA helicase